MSVPLPLEGIGPLPEPLARLFERNAVVTCEQAYELLGRLSPSCLDDDVAAADLALIRQRLHDLLGAELLARMERMAAEGWLHRFPLGALPPDEGSEDEHEEGQRS